MALLTRSQILEAKDRDYETIDCPEWGGEVRLRSISGTQRDEYEQSMVEQRGGRFQTFIKGTDELQTTHENVMLEACNTSFQVHWQCDPADYARVYNIAQLVTAPQLACAVN